MNNQEYEQKKRECWAVFKKQSECEGGCLMADAFFHAFDRAYALGREKETISQEEIEKASVEYADKTAKQYEVCNSEFVQEIMVAFEQGANFALGKQEKDAEGEEMLCVSRKRVQELYVEAQKAVPTCEHDRGFRRAELTILRNLFGSKCLPDEPANEDNFATKEPKPAEPKFKRGDTVMVVGVEKYDGIVFPILDRRYSNQGWIYEINIHEWINEAWLEPYTESKEKESERLQAKSVETLQITSEESHLRNLSQETANCDKQFDNILKDSFSKEWRLNVAAMAMQGILSNIDLFRKVLETGMETLDGKGISFRAVAKASFLFADALLKEAEKGSNE